MHREWQGSLKWSLLILAVGAVQFLNGYRMFTKGSPVLPYVCVLVGFACVAAFIYSLQIPYVRITPDGLYARLSFWRTPSYFRWSTLREVRKPKCRQLILYTHLDQEIGVRMYMLSQKKVAAIQQNISEMIDEARE